MHKVQQLQELYANRSKHSNYQILSKQLTQFLPADSTLVKSRLEQERLDYIVGNLDVKNKTVLDIGGNTGFFSFELLDKGAKHVHYFEGNKEHADFVNIASEVLEVNDKMTITNAYLNFNKEIDTKYDVILLLNVLHHVGDDYGDEKLIIEGAKKQMITQLNSLQKRADYIVFQLGFNWKGNRNLGLFEKGTKKELIDFVSIGTKGVYEIESVGVAEKQGEKIVYNKLNDSNIKRDDSIGEFLNRPIFILKSTENN